MRTAHLISDELFSKALEEIAQGNRHVVYDSSRYLLELQDMYFLKDEAAARVFIDVHAPSSENMQTFKADSLVDIYHHFEAEQVLKEYSQLKNTIMEENNYEQLTKSLFYTGYGDTLNEQLKAKMAAGEKEFTLSHSISFNKEQADAILYFRKSDTSDMYFFNKHELSISMGHSPEHLTQTFYINFKQDNITLKEGLNMLQQRAVYKELTNKDGEKYNAWVQLNFNEHDASNNFKIRSFNDGYGFKLEEVLAKYPITALKDEQEKKMLIESLQRGNRQSVTLEADGKQVKAFIEAAPQYKGLNFYDQHMNKKLAHELTVSPEGSRQSKTQKTSAGDDEMEAKSKQKKNARGQRM